MVFNVNELAACAVCCRSESDYMCCGVWCDHNCKVRESECDVLYELVGYMCGVLHGHVGYIGVVLYEDCVTSVVC